MPKDVTAGDLPLTVDKSDAEREEFFEARVRPVLASHCLDCHGVEKHKGGLRLDARDAMLRGGDTGPVVVPGKPDESPLIEAIGYGGEVQMPPKGKLKDEEIAALTGVGEARRASGPHPALPSIGDPSPPPTRRPDQPPTRSPRLAKG